MKNSVRQGSAQPNSLRRDEVYIQHDPDSNKVFGIWAGSKNDKRRCIVPSSVVHKADEEDHSVLPEEKFVGLNSTTSAVQATLPDPDDINDGHEVTIADDGGAAATNNITVATPGAETVAGAATATISTNNAILKLMWDAENTNWIDVS